jgi:LacI family transcriptional regulator
MARRPTIRDVAERAGVHPGTASRALNPAHPGRIAEPTASRVRAAAHALGYTPDPAARSLRTRRSGLVGVVVPDLTNPVLPPIVRGIEETLWAAGLACLVADTDNDVEREAVALRELRARRCDGLVIASATRDSPTVRALAGGDLPAVLVTRDVDGAGLTFVAGDDAAGVEAAVRHLLDLGHARIAYLAGPPELSTTVTRLAAVRRTLAAGGTAEPVVVFCSAYAIAEGRRAGRALLASHTGVTAILAGNDMLAIGVYEALADAGLRCPEDVSVAGHNDMPLVGKLAPPLTTVAIPREDIGVAAARVLLDRLAGEAVPRRTLLPTRLVVRASTAAPRPPGPRG